MNFDEYFDLLVSKFKESLDALESEIDTYQRLLLQRKIRLCREQLAICIAAGKIDEGRISNMMDQVVRELDGN